MRETGKQLGTGSRRTDRRLMGPGLREAPNFPDAGPRCSLENAIPARTKGLLGACLFLRFHLGLKDHTLPSASQADGNGQRFVVLTREKVKRIAIPLIKTLASPKPEAQTLTCATP